MNKTLVQVGFVLAILAIYYFTRERPPAPAPVTSAPVAAVPTAPAESGDSTTATATVVAAPEARPVEPEPTTSFEKTATLSEIALIHIQRNLKKHFKGIDKTMDETPRQGLLRVQQLRDSYPFVYADNPGERYLLEQTVLDNLARIDDFEGSPLDGPSTALRDSLYKTSFESLIKNKPDKENAARTTVEYGSYLRSESIRQDLLNIFYANYPGDAERRKIESEIRRLQDQQKYEETHGDPPLHPEITPPVPVDEPAH